MGQTYRTKSVGQWGNDEILDFHFASSQKQKGCIFLVVTNLCVLQRLKSNSLCLRGSIIYHLDTRTLTQYNRTTFTELKTSQIH